MTRFCVRSVDVDDTVVFYLIARRAVPLVVASARDRPVFLRRLELFHRDRARCHACPAVGRRNHRVRARGARRDARLVRLRLARAARTGDPAQDVVVQGRVRRLLFNGQQPEAWHIFSLGMSCAAASRCTAGMSLCL